MSIVLRFIFTYSTVTGRKCEINIIVIVIVMYYGDHCDALEDFSVGDVTRSYVRYCTNTTTATFVSS